MSIHISKDECVGCRICELACSFQKYGLFNPRKSNIRVHIDSAGDIGVSIRASCNCGAAAKPLCVELCPVGAIKVPGGETQ